jgi:DNA-binding NarL/FixJ family response regulator
MPIRILIADDHAVFRAEVRAMLEKEPDLAIVGETEDGPPTIEAAARKDVDVLLLDISMPTLSGPIVAEAVLKQRPDLAIVVLTMHEEMIYVEELFKIGTRAFVLKKSAAAELLPAIRAAYGGERYIDSTIAGSQDIPRMHWKSEKKPSHAPDPEVPQK